MIIGVENKDALSYAQDSIFDYIWDVQKIIAAHKTVWKKNRSMTNLSAPIFIRVQAPVDIPLTFLEIKKRLESTKDRLKVCAPENNDMPYFDIYAEPYLLGWTRLPKEVSRGIEDVYKDALEAAVGSGHKKFSFDYFPPIQTNLLEELKDPEGKKAIAMNKVFASEVSALLRQKGWDVTHVGLVREVGRQKNKPAFDKPVFEKKYYGFRITLE